MGANSEQKSNVFMQAVEATPEIAAAYKSGLQALSHADAAKIAVRNTRKIDGSVDIDSTVKSLYPQANRWDYAIGYDSKVCFVEVHPAYTSEIDTVVKKLNWLKEWLKGKASKLDALPKMNPAFVWVQSGKCAILPTSKQAKRLSELGMPKPLLTI